MRMRNLDFYISLNEAFKINPDIKNIFNGITMFNAKGFTPDKLFRALRYECGDRLLNYKFKCVNNSIDVSEDAIEDIRTYIELFTSKYQYKYEALLESESFEYDPLDNVDMTENENNKRTPNLSQTLTLNTTKTNDLQDKTDYGKKDTVSEKTTYNSKVADSGGTTYGRKDTTTVTSDVSTHSVVPYDTNQFSDSDKDSHTENSNVQASGTDNTNNTRNFQGYDNVDTTSTLSGSDTVSHTGTMKDTGTRTNATTGTENYESKETKQGFQPQYSISSRQDMVQKYRDVTDFSTVYIYIREVANYILLSIYE